MLGNNVKIHFAGSDGEEIFYEALNAADVHYRLYSCYKYITNTVVSGHQRLNVLEAQGETEVQVSVVDLDTISEKQLNVVLNKAQGKWDDEKLYALLDELGEDARNTGFTDAELETLRESAHYFDQPDQQPDGDPQDEDFFLLTLTFDEADKKDLKSYIKKNGDAGIIQTIVMTAKGEL